MNLRSLPDDLSSAERCEARRQMIEQELSVDLSALAVNSDRLGSAEEKNCEQMFGHVPVPVGLAGPLDVTVSSQERMIVHLPLATTEGALVASVNRGCKALTAAGSVRTEAKHIGITRSIAFCAEDIDHSIQHLHEKKMEWKKIGEETSDHLTIVGYDIDHRDDHLFLTLYGDTDEAMGMNMITIAAQAIGNWIVENVHGLDLITIAGNVDSDKKPSARTAHKGRGYTVITEADLPSSVIDTVLKTTPEKLVQVADAKLRSGSDIAGALGANLHAANVIAALYLATGQDAAHVVEGSLAETSVEPSGDGIKIRTRVPAVLVGVRGGGTGLPAQSQALGLLLKPETSLSPRQQLAETVGAAVLAGEISLLAAQSSQTLAESHKKLAR